MSARFLCPICAAAPVAGCAGSQVPEHSLGQSQALERAVMRCYEAHATEENRICLMPYMDGVTKVEVLEERPERLALEVGCLYRDWRKNDRGDGLGEECERRFTLGKDAQASSGSI